MPPSKSIKQAYEELLEALIIEPRLKNIALIKNYKMQDWLGVIRYSIFIEKQLANFIKDIDNRNPDNTVSIKKMFNLAQDESSDNDLMQIRGNIQFQLDKIQSMKTYFSLMIANLGDVAKTFNQMYAEVNFLSPKDIENGSKAPEITSISYSAAEGLSTSMLNNQFFSSEKKPLTITGNPALLSSKHNACPLIIGVNEGRTSSLSWHIPFSSISGPVAQDKLSAPKILDGLAQDTKFIALGMPKSLGYKLPDGIAPAKYYSLPSRLKIDTFVLSGEPASYDTSYYPKSDILILYGKDTTGAVCAWQMKDAVLGNGEGNWEKVKLGTTENPMSEWTNFLSHHYSNELYSKDILSEDKLMGKFIEYSAQLDQKNEILSDTESILTSESADSRQQTADSRQQTADSRQQTADSDDNTLVVPESEQHNVVKGPNVEVKETDDGLQITFDLGEYRRDGAPQFIVASLAKDGTFTLPVDQYWQNKEIASKPLVVKLGGDGLFNNFNDGLNATRAFPGGDAQHHFLHEQLAKFCEKNNINQPGVVKKEENDDTQLGRRIETLQEQFSHTNQKPLEQRLNSQQHQVIFHDPVNSTNNSIAISSPQAFQPNEYAVKMIQDLKNGDSGDRCNEQINVLNESFKTGDTKKIEMAVKDLNDALNYGPGKINQAIYHLCNQLGIGDSDLNFLRETHSNQSPSSKKV